VSKESNKEITKVKKEGIFMTNEFHEEVETTQENTALNEEITQEPTPVEKRSAKKKKSFFLFHNFTTSTFLQRFPTSDLKDNLRSRTNVLLIV